MERALGKDYETRFCFMILGTFGHLLFQNSGIFFSKSTFQQQKKIIQEYHLSVNQFGSRSGPTFWLHVRPDLDPI